MPIRNPGRGAQLSVKETEVFNGPLTADEVWQDLDLSPTIGEKPSLVLLKATTSSFLGCLGVRKKGDTDDFYRTLNNVGQGCALSDLAPSADHYVFLVATDDLGVIQICGEKPGEDDPVYVIDIIAYIN